MMRLRPVIAQFYRGGKKSLGRRDFSSLGDGGYMEQAGSVMMDCFAYGVGMAFGAGSAAVLFHVFGGSNSAMAKEIERDWEIKQQGLEELERVLERDQKYYGIKSSAKPTSA